MHDFDDRDIRAVVDELVVGPGRVGPAPCVGESVELRLAHFAAGLAKENVVVRVRIKRGIEINKIDTRIRELFRVPQLGEIVTEIEAVHFPFSSGCCTWMQRSVSTGFTIAGSRAHFDGGICMFFPFDGY